MPTHPRAVRALQALGDQRWSDASDHVAALPETPLGERAWKLHLDGLIQMEAKDLAAAERAFLQSAGLSLLESIGPGNSPADGDRLRLAAWSLDGAGVVLRRCERASDAMELHRAAYHLRFEHGSWEEIFEATMNLGLDCDLARRPDQAREWYLTAIDAAQRASQGAAAKQAAAWGQLSSSLSEAGQWEQAIQAARTSRTLWAEVDTGSPQSARADLALAALLLARSGEFDAADDSILVNLREARELLPRVRDALMAFGAGYEGDVRWCEDQIDFAERLWRSRP